ncbi:lipopolysaccharide heptosyltransferase I [Desulfatiferula olefinivorans]
MRIRHRTIRKILVIQLQPFGDVFLTTAYFKALKARYPKARLYYLMKAPYQKIVSDHPYIDELIVIPKQSGLRYLIERLKMFRRLRREKFDLVIDQQNMPSSQILAFITGAPYRVGYTDDRNNLNFLYNIHARFGPARYSGQQKFDILKPLGMVERSCHLTIPISEADRNAMKGFLRDQGFSPERTLVLSPGSRFPVKKWPADCFAKVADMMADHHGFRSLVVWGPDEKDDALRVASLAKRPVIPAPPTTFQQLGAILENATLLVCNDNAVNHCSTAFGVTTFSVFGPTDPRCWSPAGIFPTHHHLHNPDRDNRDPSFGLTPEHVFSVIETALCLSKRTDALT